MSDVTRETQRKIGRKYRAGVSKKLDAIAAAVEALNTAVAVVLTEKGEQRQQEESR